MEFSCKCVKIPFLFFIVLQMCVCNEENNQEFHFDDSGDFGDQRFPSDNSGRTYRKPKFVDVYTNHPHVQDVEDNFYKLHPPKTQYHHHHHHQTKNNSGHRIISKYPNPIMDRKDTPTFPHMDKLFSSSKNDFLESDYGDFEEPNQNSGGYFTTEKKWPNGNTEKIVDIDPYNGNIPDRNEYLYPSRPPFFTKNPYKHPDNGAGDQKQNEKDSNSNFVFLQSQVEVPDAENYGSFYVQLNDDSGSGFDPDRRPDFWTGRRKVSAASDQVAEESEDLGIGTRPYSYVQRIPFARKLTTTTTVFPDDPSTETNLNRYEEVEFTENSVFQEEKPKETRKRINDMMKTYLAKLLVEKYALKQGENGPQKNISNVHAVKNKRKYLGTPNIATQNDTQITEQESKFLYSNSLWDLKNLKKKTVAKIKQFFSLFTIIKFNNTECNATNWAGTWQGVCLSTGECTQWNGTALGNCANGYGVCCVFRGSCGDSSRRNCTYFKSPNYPDYYPSSGGVITPTTTVAPTSAPTPDPRLYWYYYKKGMGDTGLDNVMMGRQSTSDTLSCVYRVFKTNANVQQFRIDFIDLDLASPTNGTCTTERFIITGQNSNDQIPVLCGYNTGQHVYVDVSLLNGPLQIMILSTTGVRKRFKVRICQYSDVCSTSQSNCLQYYTGVSGVIQSFNYDQAAVFNRSSPGYFNNLNYAICIRREAGYCSITYTNVRSGQTNPLQLVNSLPDGQSTVPIGQAGVDVLNCPDDYIIIDGTRLCGDRFNDGSTAANFSVNAPVIGCIPMYFQNMPYVRSGIIHFLGYLEAGNRLIDPRDDTSTGPIVINFRTNSNVTGLGFRLFYTQNRCTTS